MVLETTLDEDSGLEVLWASLESLLTGVKGDPEVPNTGKYPVVWLEWRAGEEWRRELPGERKGELRSSADLRSSWIWFWSCCSCWRWADCSAAEWSSAGLAAPENNKDDEPWRNTIKYNSHLPLLTSSSKQDDWCFRHRLSKMNRRNLLNCKGEKQEGGIINTGSWTIFEGMKPSKPSKTKAELGHSHNGLTGDWTPTISQPAQLRGN